ncbi:MAG: thioredoxin [Candidatus Latescibacterota bacterium]
MATHFDALKKDEVPSDAIELTDANVDQALGRFPLLVVDCWAPWCGPCRMMAPVIDELAGEYAGRIVFAKVNVDENAKTASKYGIRSIPALLVFQNGKVVDQLVGAQPKNTLEIQLAKYLK